VVDQELLAVLASQGTDWDKRFTELAVFPRETAVPLTLVARYWQETGGLSAADTRRLCGALAELGLVQFGRDDAEAGNADPGSAGRSDTEASEAETSHAPARAAAGEEFLRVSEPWSRAVRRRSGPAQRRLLAVMREWAGLGAAGEPFWWEMPADVPYLWRNLTYHLAAGGGDGLGRLLGDLRWAVAQLERSGPEALDADLARSSDPAVVRLRKRCAQAAHLFHPGDPGHVVAATLLGLLSGDELLAQAVRRWQAGSTVSRLVPTTPAAERVALLRSLPCPGAFEVAIAPDGSWLVGVGTDGLTRLWNRDGSVRATLAAEPVVAVTIASNGSWLASAGYDGHIRLWNADGSPRADWSAQTGVGTLAAAPDGSWLASAGYDGHIRLWNADGSPRADWSAQTRVGTLAAAPDGSWLAGVGVDGLVRLWNTDGSPRGIVGGRALSVAIAPSGGWMAVGSQTYRDPSSENDMTIHGHVTLWDTSGNGRVLARLYGHTGNIGAVAIAADGSRMVSAAWDGSIQVWDLADAESDAVQACRARRSPEPTGGVLSQPVAVAADGSWLASADDSGRIRVWNADGSPRAVLTGHTSFVSGLAIAPDGSWLASSSDDGTIRLWSPDQETGETDLGEVEAIAAVPDGSWFASISEDGAIQRWNTDGRLEANLAHHAYGAAIAVAPDGTWLASTGYDHRLRLWNADGTLRAARRTIASVVTIAPDGTWLATSNGGRIRLWNADGSRRRTIPRLWSRLRTRPRRGWRKGVRALAIAPDSSWIAGAYYDGTVRLWDATTGTLRATLTDPAAPGSTSIQCVAIAPDGGWFATGDTLGLGTIRLWDPDGGVRATLTGHTASVNAVAIAPDGSWLASADHDGTLRVWDSAHGVCTAAVRVDSRLNHCAIMPDGEHILLIGSAGTAMWRYTAP
jgi:WD40 repeat protein